MRPAVMEVCNGLHLSEVWITPFFRISENVPKERELKKFLAPFQAPGVRVILQIMGVHPQRLAETALRGLSAGADGIDLNCGCPSNQVIRHGAGSGAWRDPENTARIIEAVRSSVGNAFFSVKTRLGFDDFSEAARVLKLWSSAADVDMFTLHYRTRREGYLSVPGRLERLSCAVKYLAGNALVFGNGDVKSISEAENLCKQVPLHGVMIGRGFWRDPFVIARKYQDVSEDAESARHVLWQALSKLPYREKYWSLGSAIELCSLILGADSPEAMELKAAARRNQ